MKLAYLSILLLPAFSLAVTNEQVPLGASIDMADPREPLTTPQPTLADLLTIEPSASIFYSYARELELSVRFGDMQSKSTLLVPTNKAVMALARKPHLDPKPVDDGISISEEEYDARSKRNVERWVSAHIIPEYLSPISVGTHATLLEGKPLRVTEQQAKPDAPEWSRVILNEGIHIIAAKEALNGILYLVDDTVKID